MPRQRSMSVTAILRQQCWSIVANSLYHSFMQKGLLVCLLVGLTTSSTTARPQEQATLEVVSSVPAPAEIFGRSGWQPSMVGCGSDETITTYLQLRHEIVKFGLNGAVSVRIDTAHLLGPGETRVESFAPGPNGELYVMATKATRPKNGVTYVSGYPTLFRFDANGRFIISRRMSRSLRRRLPSLTQETFFSSTLDRSTRLRKRPCFLPMEWRSSASTSQELLWTGERTRRPRILPMKD